MRLCYTTYIIRSQVKVIPIEDSRLASEIGFSVQNNLLQTLCGIYRLNDK